MRTSWSRPPFDPAVGRAMGTNRPNTAEAARAVAEDASALVRAEIELAKAELTRAARAKATGSVLMVVAAVLLWLGIQAVLVSAGLALALVMPGWAAALIVAGVLILPAVVLIAVGTRKVRTPVALDTTKANVEEDIAWTRQHLARRSTNEPTG